MTKGRLILLWVLAAWLVFALLFPAYHPAKTGPRRLEWNSDYAKAMRAAGLVRPAYWQLEPKQSLLLAIPGLLLAIPLWFTLKKKKINQIG